MQTGLSSQLNAYSAQARIEYSVYAYSHFKDDELGHNHWKRVMVGSDVSAILLQAEKLFCSEKYQKIEIKKKIFDDKKGRNVASTFRIFENKSQNKYVRIGTVLLLTISCAGLLYLKYL